MGTCGWSYNDWLGPFYPKGTPAGEMLKRYAEVFDTVEVNSTFYAVPPRQRVAAWAGSVPDGFTFSVKAPQGLTHEARLTLSAGREVLDAFLAAIEPLGDKLGCVLLQLPPGLDRAEGLDRLDRLLSEEPFWTQVAVEARHPSWDHAEVLETLRAHQAGWVWSENMHWTSQPELTAGHAYLRLIGDRELETFDRLQRDPAPAAGAWWERLHAREGELETARVYANNHFAGFGPGTANAFLEAAGQSPRAWRGGTQARLGEFE